MRSEKEVGGLLGERKEGAENNGQRKNKSNKLASRQSKVLGNLTSRKATSCTQSLSTKRWIIRRSSGRPCVPLSGQGATRG